MAKTFKFEGAVEATSLKSNILNAPTTSGGSTYGVGSSGQVLKSNGTSIYWGTDNSGSTSDGNYYHSPTSTTGIKIGTGVGVSDLYVPTGTSASTVCIGNDSRLSNSRTPTSHASSLTTYGVGTTSNYGHVKIQTGNITGTSSSNGIAAGLGHYHTISNYISENNSSSKHKLLGVNSSNEAAYIVADEMSYDAANGRLQVAGSMRTSSLILADIENTDNDGIIMYVDDENDNSYISANTGLDIAAGGGTLKLSTGSGSSININSSSSMSITSSTAMNITSTRRRDDNRIINVRYKFSSRY